MTTGKQDQEEMVSTCGTLAGIVIRAEWTALAAILAGGGVAGHVGRLAVLARVALLTVTTAQ